MQVEDPGQATPRCVLCFGDSNTHGTRAMRTPTDRRRFSRELRWPSVMAQALGRHWEVVAEGHPGRTAVFDDPVEGAHKNGQRMLQALLESHRPLDLVIVMLGTNDLKARFNVGPVDIALGLQRLVTEIRRSDSGPDNAAPQVLLAAPVPITETGIFVDVFSGGADKSSDLPDVLRQIAERQGVAFVDLGKVAEVDPVDGVHLTADAHARIGVAMAEAVGTVFPQAVQKEI
jgi:lysophospholipase L1-like esterase